MVSYTKTMSLLSEKTVRDQTVIGMYYTVQEKGIIEHFTEISSRVPEKQTIRRKY